MLAEVGTILVGLALAAALYAACAAFWAIRRGDARWAPSARNGVYATTALLGWGGYWGWDPVENAGLMPWLTATTG